MRSRSFWIGVFGGIVASILLGLFALPALGVFDMTATGKPGLLDWWGHTNWRSSLMWRAPEQTAPDSAAPNQGLEHYRSSCLMCHGAPKVSRAEWAHHMQPMPPKLWKKGTQNLSDGKLYHIVHNGVRMTGMPAFGQKHTESDIWNIVALVRELDSLSKKQQQKLKEAASEYQHRHGGDDGHHEHGNGEQAGAHQADLEHSEETRASNSDSGSEEQSNR